MTLAISMHSLRHGASCTAAHQQDSRASPPCTWHISGRCIRCRRWSTAAGGALPRAVSCKRRRGSGSRCSRTSGTHTSGSLAARAARNGHDAATPAGTKLAADACAPPSSAAPSSAAAAAPATAAGAATHAAAAAAATPPLLSPGTDTAAIV